MINDPVKRANVIKALHEHRDLFRSEKDAQRFAVIIEEDIPAEIKRNDITSMSNMIDKDRAIGLVSKPICPTGDETYDNAREEERESIREELDAIPHVDPLKAIINLVNHEALREDLPEDIKQYLFCDLRHKLWDLDVNGSLRGKWILKDDVFYCSCCGKESQFTADDVYVYDVPLPEFCEKCGCHMEGNKR